MTTETTLKPSQKVKRPAESILSEQRMRKRRGKKAKHNADFIYGAWK